MDIEKILERLYQERELLSEAIHALESMAAEAAEKPQRASRRGRKSMSQKEREEVSRRMRAYWADRRKSK